MTAGGEGSALPDRRGYLTALGILGLGALLVLVGYGRTWSTSVVHQTGLPTLEVTLTGRDIEPAGAAAALVALAGIAGLVALRRAGRLAAGVLLVLVGGGSAYGALSFGLGRRDAVTTLVSERAGADVAAVTTVTPWWLVAVVGGVLVAVAGVLAVVAGGRWPSLGRRYERDGGPTPATGAPARSESSWDQLDRGVDPTVGPDLPSNLDAPDVSDDPSLRPGPGH